MTARGLVVASALAACAACAPDLVIEDTPRPPRSAIVVDPRTGTSLLIDVALQQSAKTVRACAEVLSVSVGSTATGRRCESVSRAIARGPVDVTIEVPGLPFDAQVLLAVTAEGYDDTVSTPLVVEGTPGHDVPPLTSLALAAGTGGEVVLSWTLADALFGTKTLVIVRREATPPEAPDDPAADLVYDGDPAALGFVDDAARFTDDLVYGAWARDDDGALSLPVFAATAP